MNNNKLYVCTTWQDCTQEFFELFSTVDINRKVGFLAGEFLREHKTIFLGDALIAATCVVKILKLMTNNTRHFNKVDDLQFYEVS